MKKVGCLYLIKYNRELRVCIKFDHEDRTFWLTKVGYEDIPSSAEGFYEKDIERIEDFRYMAKWSKVSQ